MNRFLLALSLLALCAQVKSPLFFAHVRASTGTATSRNNCHPFTHGRWSFMHNGQVGGYDAMRRDADMLIPDALYPQRKGATDSEALFLVALAEGLEHDPCGAMERAAAQFIRLSRAKGAAPGGGMPPPPVDLPSTSAVQVLLERTATACGQSFKSRAMVSNFEAGLRMTRAGLAICVAPREIFQATPNLTNLRWIALADAWATRRFLLCFKKGEQLSAAARQLKQHLQAGSDGASPPGFRAARA